MQYIILLIGAMMLLTSLRVNLKSISFRLDLLILGAITTSLAIILIIKHLL